MKKRVHSNITLKAPQRYIFLNKELTEGYVGKKQFHQKKVDNVVIQSPGSCKFIRKDKLFIGDIEGAKPSLKIQVVENLNKFHRNSNNSEIKARRNKTEGEDSLDKLVKSRDLTDFQYKKPIQTQNEERMIAKNRFELSKGNILGIYPPYQGHYQQKTPIKSHYRSPTYLSSLYSIL